ncbi:hypothetical protein, partial [Thermococcus sp. MAR1]
LVFSDNDEKRQAVIRVIQKITEQKATSKLSKQLKAELKSHDIDFSKTEISILIKRKLNRKEIPEDAIKEAVSFLLQAIGPEDTRL